MIGTLVGVTRSVSHYQPWWKVPSQPHPSQANYFSHCDSVATQPRLDVPIPAPTWQRTSTLGLVVAISDPSSINPPTRGQDNLSRTTLEDFSSQLIEGVANLKQTESHAELLEVSGSHLERHHEDRLGIHHMQRLRNDGESTVVADLTIDHPLNPHLAATNNKKDGNFVPTAESEKEQRSDARVRGDRQSMCRKAFPLATGGPIATYITEGAIDIEKFDGKRVLTRDLTQIQLPPDPFTQTQTHLTAHPCYEQNPLNFLSISEIMKQPLTRH